MSDNNSNVVKVELVVVNGVMDREASIANFVQRVERWTEEKAKDEADKLTEDRLGEMTRPEMIAQASAKVLTLFANRNTPRELYMSELLSSLSSSDGTRATHPDLYQRAKNEVEAWFSAQVKDGLIITKKGRYGGIKAADSNMVASIAQAAE